MATRVAIVQCKAGLAHTGAGRKDDEVAAAKAGEHRIQQAEAVGMPLYLSASGPLIFCRLVRVSTMLEESGVSALESRPERIS